MRSRKSSLPWLAAVAVLAVAAVAFYAGGGTRLLAGQTPRGILPTATRPALPGVSATAGPVSQFVRSEDTAPAQASVITYRNPQYGFTFDLPLDWTGFSVLTGQWTGQPLGPTAGAAPTGPMLTFRNPKWTEQVPYQDIPILILTIDQWNALQNDEFHIGAAPINPSELGRNSRYVFALPARWDFTAGAGLEETHTIINSHPLHPFEPEAEATKNPME